MPGVTFTNDVTEQVHRGACRHDLRQAGHHAGPGGGLQPRLRRAGLQGGILMTHETMITID
jgi:hypothetical protein